MLSKCYGDDAQPDARPPPPPAAAADGHSHSHEHGDHSSEVVALGTVQLQGSTFAVDREGECEAGKSCTFGVEAVGAAREAPSDAWVENAAGERVCEPVTGEGHDKHWHFTIAPAAGAAAPARFVLRLGDATERIALAAGAAPRHDGILTPLRRGAGGEAVGFAELKLHDDAGDLELWLSGAAGGGAEPLDVPAATVITLAFPSHGGRSIELRVRNGEQNEDEDGVPNMRGGRTCYFIFPGETGADPEWLKGESWRGVVELAFESEGVNFACDPFVLVPHSVL